MGKFIKITEEIKELYAYEESKLEELEFYEKSISSFKKFVVMFFQKNTITNETSQSTCNHQWFPSFTTKHCNGT